MRKFTFVLLMMLAYAGFTMAQTIENFESIKMNIMEPGTTGMMTVVPNPDPVGNPSLYCVKFIRPGVTNGGKPWSGFWASLPVAVDVTVNQYVHVKVWKSRTSPLHFKLEGGAAGNLEIPSINPNVKTNAWEDIVFNFTTRTGTYPIIAFMPDFEDPLVQAADLTMYFDEIYVNNDPTPGSAAVKVLENFETIPLEPFSAVGKCTLIPNPDKKGINLSDYVLDYLRPKNDVAWSGFFSHLPATTVFDVTTNHYVHVKMWKPSISDASFKLEGGPQPAKEFLNMKKISEIKKWQDIVFNLSTYSGVYPTIGVLADQNGAAFTEDIHIYIDDIILNNEPNPSVSVTFNVDAKGAGLTAGQKVYLAGTFPDWVEPGKDPAFEMLDPDGDKIYSISLIVPTGLKKFKFFKGAGWNGGEWVAGEDRALDLKGDAVVNSLWGTNGFVGKRENTLANKIQMYPNPVRDELTINSTVDVSRVIITNTVGKVVGNINYTSNQTINTANLSKGMYFVTFIGRDGNKVTQKLIKD